MATLCIQSSLCHKVVCFFSTFVIIQLEVGELDALLQSYSALVCVYLSCPYALAFTCVLHMANVLLFEFSGFIVSNFICS